MNYVFIDEIQYAIRKEDFKKDEPLPLYGVLNGLLRRNDVDVYVTGSNSKLLSKDVLTEFRGRGDEVRVFPLSFGEFYGYLGGIKPSCLRNTRFTAGSRSFCQRKTQEKRPSICQTFSKKCISKISKSATAFFIPA